MRGRRAAALGFTLLEQLVGMALLVLLLVLTWQILSPSLQIWQINSVRSDIEQTGIVVQYKILRELEYSDSSSVTVVSANPPAIAFMSVDTGNTVTTGGYDSSTGKPTWQQFVIYYLDTTNQILYRKTWPNTSLSTQVPALSYTFPTTTAAAMSSADVQSCCTTENNTETRVGYYVNSLTATNGTPLTLSLELSEESPNGMESTLRQCSVWMRN